MSVEREGSKEPKNLSEARILMVSRFGPGKVGGIPSILMSLERVWKEYAREVLSVNPENQSRVDLNSNWDLAIFHHTSMFGVRKFLELPERLKERSNFIWYQAVDEETLKTFARLGVGNTRFIPSALKIRSEIMSRRFLANYPGVINYAISNNVRESLQKANIGSGKEINVVEVPSLFPENNHKIKEFEERGDGKFVILIVSRISPEKGIENVIETYKNLFRLVQNNPDMRLTRPVKFIVAGGHTNNSYFESIMEQVGELPSNDNCQIEFVGKKTDREVFDLYQNSHLFLMPGIYDSWGLVTMEALSYGLPVVGFEAPGTKEIFEQSQSQIGNLVGSGEVAAKSIVDIMINIDLWKKLSAGALRESDRHNPKQVSINLLNKFWNDRYR
ncbi:MAG: glycosyltransferase family 4 protein, partial [Patescibacteria group bacterium]